MSTFYQPSDSLTQVNTRDGSIHLLSENDSLTKMNDFTGRELSINQVIKYTGEIPKGVNTTYLSNDSLTQVDTKGKNTSYQPCDSLTKVNNQKLCEYLLSTKR